MQEGLLCKNPSCDCKAAAECVLHG